ncbi:hypothetical protein J6A31_05820 [bacterium]|nr:hypothetical protein [bacterium]
MENSKQILYSNYNLDELYNDAVKNIEGYYDDEPIPESEIWDEVSRINNDNWNTFYSELQKFIKKYNRFLIMGSVEKWCGHFDTGFLVTNLDELSAVWSEYRYVEFYDENGHLWLRCGSPNGDTSLHEIKIISDAGMKYHNQMTKGHCNDRPVYEHMFENDELTSIPHLADEIDI